MKFLRFCFGTSNAILVNRAVPAVVSSRTTLTELPYSDRVLGNATF